MPGEKSQEELVELVQNLMKSKKKMIHGQNDSLEDPKQRLAFYLSLLREIGIVKKSERPSIKNGPEEDSKKDT